jgi:predicted MFS family arabinose efflux permease
MGMTTTERLEKNPLRLIWIGWWVTLVTVSDLYFIPPLFPNFLTKFEVDVAVGAWIVAIYQLGAATVVLGSGLLVDRIGCRLVLAGSMILFGMGEALSALSPNFSVFLAARCMVGAGSAAASLALTTYIGLHIDYRLRGKIMGFIGTAYFLGISFGPLITTQIADRANVETLFWTYTFLAWIGAAHSAFSLQPDRCHTVGKRWRDFAVVCRNQGFWGIVIAQTFFSLGVVPMIHFFGKWLETAHGLDTQHRGFVFAIGGIPIVLGSPMGGWICDRIGKKPFFAFVTLVMAPLTCSMPYMDTSLVGVVLLFSGVGFVAATRYSAYHALSTRLIEQPYLGHLLALRNFINYLVTAGGVVLMGWVYDSSAESGYIRMGWMTTLFLIASVPFLLKMIPREPEEEGVPAEAVAAEA